MTALYVYTYIRIYIYIYLYIHFPFPKATHPLPRFTVYCCLACARALLYPPRWQCILCNARLFIIAWPAFALLFNPSRGNAPHMQRPDTSYHLSAHMLPLPEGTAPSAAGSLSLNPSRNIWGRRWYNYIYICIYIHLYMYI